MLERVLPTQPHAQVAGILDDEGDHDQQACGSQAQPAHNRLLLALPDQNEYHEEQSEAISQPGSSGKGEEQPQSSQRNQAAGYQPAAFCLTDEPGSDKNESKYQAAAENIGVVAQSVGAQGAHAICRDDADPVARWVQVQLSQRFDTQ